MHAGVRVRGIDPPGVTPGTVSNATARPRLNTTTTSIVYDLHEPLDVDTYQQQRILVASTSRARRGPLLLYRISAYVPIWYAPRQRRKSGLGASTSLCGRTNIDMSEGTFTPPSPPSDTCRRLGWLSYGALVCTNRLTWHSVTGSRGHMPQARSAGTRNARGLSQTLLHWSSAEGARG